MAVVKKKNCMKNTLHLTITHLQNKCQIKIFEIIESGGTDTAFDRMGC